MINRLVFIFIAISSLLFSEGIEVIESFDENPPVNIQQTNQYIAPAVKIKKVKSQNTLSNSYKKNSTNDKNISVKKINNKNDTVKKLKKSPAKLLIIIDDISHRYQLNMIKSLPFKVTPSIFPPTRMNMQSYKLAKGLKHFMVHLPLESYSRQMNKIYKVIHIKDSQKQINRRLKEIRRLFPGAKYINNHTGSKFSENYAACDRLYKALIDNGFIFLDSRTSRKTQFPKIAKKYHKRYLKSDLFIDNTITVKAIEKELKQGVALAKRQGYAVIIGHPHPQTFKALKNLAKLIQSLKTVYIDEF